MARRFRRKPGTGIMPLPGLPGIGNDEIVEGDGYAKYCPVVLEEVFDKPVRTKVAPLPDPEPEPEAVSGSDPDPESDEEADPPSMGWRRDDLVDYAEGIGLDSDDKTKRQILAAIEEAEA